MEMTAATATARGGDDGGGDHNDDNGAIAMVINLDLRTAVVRRYVARLNLTGGMAVSLFFQGDGVGTRRRAVPRELLALGPPSSLADPPSSGGDSDVDGECGDAGGGRTGAATSRMTAITKDGIRWGRTRPWRRRTTTTATEPPRARPI